MMSSIERHDESLWVPGRYNDRCRPLFDSAWYAATNLDVRLSGAEPYEHYRLFGRYERRAPSAFSPFDPDRLPKPPKDAAVAWFDEQTAVVERSNLFDADWYARTYGIARENALHHYIHDGAYVGCDPTAFFSSVAYFMAFRDVLDLGINPLAHYVTDGRVEIAIGKRKDRRENGIKLDEDAWVTGRCSGAVNYHLL